MQLGEITLGLQAAQTASNTECRNLRYLTSFTVTGGERFITFLNVFFLIFHVFNVFFGFVLERFSHLCLSLTRITPSITVHINGNRITLSPNPNQGYVHDGDFRGGGCPGGGQMSRPADRWPPPVTAAVTRGSPVTFSPSSPWPQRVGHFRRLFPRTSQPDELVPRGDCCAYFKNVPEPPSERNPACSSHSYSWRDTLKHFFVHWQLLD